jgi:hypothetical protein
MIIQLILVTKVMQPFYAIAGPRFLSSTLEHHKKSAVCASVYCNIRTLFSIVKKPISLPDINRSK